MYHVYLVVCRSPARIVFVQGNLNDPGSIGRFIARKVCPFLLSFPDREELRTQGNVKNKCYFCKCKCIQLGKFGCNVN